MVNGECALAAVSPRAPHPSRPTCPFRPFGMSLLREEALIINHSLIL